MRRAKIIATLGPASRSRKVLRELIGAGMDVARLNFSHGTHEEHRETIRLLRELSKELGRPVAVLQDLQGIKIRTGPLLEGKAVHLKAGQEFTLTTEETLGNSRIVSTSYRRLPSDVQPGDRILLSDGLIELEVMQTSPNAVHCRVLTAGRLGEHQGINIPGATISAPPLTRKDQEDLEFGIREEVDYIALSFVRRAADLEELKQFLHRRRADIPVIAKLERPAAIDNLDEILAVCEGVMVARGDLGVEMAPEKVPVIQKHVIRQANRHGKLVITATQMLESMVKSPRPTRAEASDVANAIFDGTDALMLSGETAKGKYPVEAVRMMAKIISEAERVDGSALSPKLQGGDSSSFPEAVCDAAFHASQAIQARAIVAFTQTGSTALLISKYRPKTPILGLTPHQSIVHRMCLYWGVLPLQMQAIRNVDELIQALEKLLLEKNLTRPGDNLIILTGAPIIEKGHTSLMKLHCVKG